MAHIGDDWSFCPECGAPTGLGPDDAQRACEIESAARAGDLPAADAEETLQCLRCKRAGFGLDMKAACTCGSDLFSLEEDMGVCPHFQSRYIEFPLTIQGIDYQDFGEYLRRDLTPVSVRPCDSKETYLGFLLGDMGYDAYAYYKPDSGRLAVGLMTNPAIFVPDLGRVVWGFESWWSRISSMDDVRAITDKDISGQWYVQLLRTLLGQQEEVKGGKSGDA